MYYLIDLQSIMLHFFLKETVYSYLLLIMIFSSSFYYEIKNGNCNKYSLSLRFISCNRYINISIILEQKQYNKWKKKQISRIIDIFSN